MVREVTVAGDGAGAAATPAAGLLLRAPDARCRPQVLLRRGGDLWGDLWGIPGGARCARAPDETPVPTALREAAVDPDRVRVRGALVHHPGGDAWSLTSVVADATEPLPTHRGPVELAWVPESAWVPEDEVTGLSLHPAFAAAWPALRVTRVGLVVDAANVVGSRPDGWWKDRAGAAERFLHEVAAAGPGVIPLQHGGFGWVAGPVVVLEGAALRAADVPGVEAVRAPGTADDTIVDLVTAPGDWLVVTADRPLRTRLPPHVHALSPSAFLSWVGA